MSKIIGHCGVAIVGEDIYAKFDLFERDDEFDALCSKVASLFADESDEDLCTHLLHGIVDAVAVGNIMRAATFAHIYSHFDADHPRFFIVEGETTKLPFECEVHFDRHAPTLEAGRKYVANGLTVIRTKAVYEAAGVA